MVRPPSELLTLAPPLSGQGDVEVRAHAGRALSVLAGPEEPLASRPSTPHGPVPPGTVRLCPTAGAAGADWAPDGLTVEFRSRVEDLAEQNPSRLVREDAARLLAQRETPSAG